MSLIRRVEVTPYNAQIELSDPNVRDYPQWQTGDEPVVAIPGIIAVATQGDDRGRVTIEVWGGSLDGNESELNGPQYDGEFESGGTFAVVGNTVGDEFYEVPLPSPRIRVRVFTAPKTGRAKAVYFVLG